MGVRGVSRGTPTNISSQASWTKQGMAVGDLFLLHHSDALDAHLEKQGIRHTTVASQWACSYPPQFTLTTTDALRAPDTIHILVHREPSSSNAPLRNRYGQKADRTDEPVKGAPGWRLRVRHDDRAMGPWGFLNIHESDPATAPWGVWFLYKGEAFDQARESFDETEALHAAEAARDMTRMWNERNEATARWLFTDAE